MGRRGPQPKPTEQKKAEGTFRADRAAAGEPTEPVAIPEMPAVIAADKDARECWERLAPILVERKTIAASHGLTFEGLCFTYSILVRAMKACQRGVVVKKKGAWVTNPAIKVAKDALSELRQYAAHFGLSPSSASRVNASGSAGEAVDPAEKFLFGEGRVAGHIRPA